MVVIYSPNGRYNSIFVSNYALVSIIDELKRLKGVGDVTIFGAKDYSICIWLHPDKLAQLKLTPKDVADTIAEQNAQFIVGHIEAEPSDQNPMSLNYMVTAKGRLTSPEEFDKIILLADQDGSLLRLQGVARTELGANDYNSITKFSGNPAVIIIVFLASGANALDTAD
ncbi:hypothetical protein DSUL_50318 [Desulfovibrionales bacterium]